MRTRLLKNDGSGLEATVVASQAGVIRLERFRSGQRFVRGGRTVGQPVPCDFIGTVVGAGRAIWFDAKSCDRPSSFNAAASHVRPHQRLALCNQGECGAVAGLLVEATHPELAAFYWLPWWQLATNETCYAWGALIEVGPSVLAVNFRQLILLHDFHTPQRLRPKGVPLG